VDQEQIWQYIRARRLPYNALHDAQYPSIGCAPCTRAIQPGEHQRAGRWWWEESASRECGLHPRVRHAAVAARLRDLIEVRMDYLPIFIVVKDAPAIVVGGGQVALRKVEWLLAAHARVTVIAPALAAELARARRARRRAAPRREFRARVLRHAALAIAATDSGEVNAAVAHAARAARVPVNVVDTPELSSFIFPAIIDRSPVIVAVGSGGRSPVLVRRVRAQIEALLPAKLGALARFMGERRAAVKLALAPRGRRPFWERIIGGAVGSQVLAGNETRAHEAFAAELSGSGSRAPVGEVYLIGAGPGDPDLLTLRALQLCSRPMSSSTTGWCRMPCWRSRVAMRSAFCGQGGR
jgi:siroheme synthase-like protein